MTTEAEHFAFRCRTFAGLFLAIGLLELRHLRVGPGAFARRPLGILLPLTGECR